MDKSAVEVGESEESLEFLDRLQLGPVTDGLDLPLVHLDAICTEDVTEELYREVVELTLLELQVEVVSPELFQDLRDVVAMFGQVPGVNQDVVDVNYDKSVEELPEHFVHEPLEDGR